jgi:hypothetical protein
MKERSHSKGINLNVNHIYDSPESRQTQEEMFVK